MQIDAGMDTGPTLLRHEVAIEPDETAPELAERMSAIGAVLIAESLTHFDRGEISPTLRNETVSYAPILKKEDGRIDWAFPHTRFTTACAASRPGPAPTPRFGNKRANSGAARQRPARSGPSSQRAKLSIPRRIFM